MRKLPFLSNRADCCSVVKKSIGAFLLMRPSFFYKIINSLVRVYIVIKVDKYIQIK
jgi:hypothetical protein